MTMTKRALLGIAMAIVLCFGCLSTAFAQSSRVNWNVTFDPSAEMVSTYNKETVNKAIQSMQPGDDLSLDVTVKNENDHSTEWYMTSTVLKTLEEASSASDGAYTFSLLFNDEELYSSETVGGTDSEEGLKEVSSATGTWFYLGTLDKNQSGKVSLRMALDGESQGNSYMNTLGTLQINFAVEYTADGTTVTVTDEPTDGPGSTLSKTGDPVTFIMVVLCAAFVLLTALSLRKDIKGGTR